MLMMIKKNKIEVLDKGHVQYIMHMGDDLSVVNAARVSFDKESTWGKTISHHPESLVQNELSDKDVKLINYLAKHNHWTPFAHPQITLRIKAPIFVRAQLGKHQVGFVMNEISRRYVTFEPDIYNPRWRTAPTNGAKQGSSDFAKPNPYVTTIYENLCEDSLEAYEELLKQGIAPEQARSVLPQGTYTEWWWTGSLSAYARVYAQRIDAHAQWEVQQYAKAIYEIVQPLYPVAWKALTETTK